MLASKQLKLLSVRLPEAEIRRFKSIAASKGVSLQEAVHEAIHAWTYKVPVIPSESLDSLQGSLAGVDIERLRREDRDRERMKDEHRF